LKHILECLLCIIRGPVGESRNNRPAGEDIGISREHDGSHGAAGGEPGDKHAGNQTLWRTSIVEGGTLKTLLH
jgi:hypothetical protein